MKYNRIWESFKGQVWVLIDIWNKRKINMDSNSQSDMTNLNRHYGALTPKNNIENGQEYMAAFDWALSKSNIHNIAISGPYGSGKSSVIESYLKQRTKLKALRISLAAFNLDEMLDGDGGVIDEGLLEVGILTIAGLSVHGTISVLIMRSMDVKGVGQNTLMRTLIHY